MNSDQATCACSIEAARLLLEASGFVISREHSLNQDSPFSASKRDEIFTMYCTIVVALVLIAGLMSGLTLGLMSLDGLDLEVRPDTCSCCKQHCSWCLPCNVTTTKQRPKIFSNASHCMIRHDEQLPCVLRCSGGVVQLWSKSMQKQ